jgi:hypothetical protein
MKDNLTPAGAESLKGKLERHWQTLSSAAPVNFWVEPPAGPVADYSTLNLEHG